MKPKIDPKKNPIFAELEKIRDESIQNLADRWHVLRQTDLKLKTNKQRLTVNDMDPAFLDRTSLKQLADHPLGKELLDYHLAALFCEMSSGIIRRVKAAVERAAVVQDNNPPAPPDVFSIFRGKKK